jgi:glutathione synthase/RimK-type ligase-like ATP-grasp enzyme
MRNIKILVNRHGRPSMKKVFKTLSKDASLIIKSSLFDGYIERPDRNNLKKKVKIRSLNPIDCKDSIVLRWGSRYEVEHNAGTIVYNKNEATKLVNDKGECRKFLQDKGIAVPKTFLINELDNANRNGKLIYPMIGRPSHHGQGRHFFVCNNYNEILNAKNKGCTYFSYFYPKTKEFGVHVGSGKFCHFI